MNDEHRRYTDGMSLVTAAPLKRLTRPVEPPAFRLTERDCLILRTLAANRFNSSEQIARAIGASHPKARHRLRLLWANGLIERPAQQHVWASSFYDEGNRPLIYSLARKGARLLAERRQLIDPRIASILNNNARTTAPFLAHTLEVAQAMLAFRASGEGTSRLIDHAELLPFLPEATRASRDPFCLSVSFTHELRPATLRVRPDRLFSLVMPDNTRCNFALELDRSTEVITPRSKHLSAKSSIKKKQLGYYHAWRQDKHTTLWGFKSFRVLFITPSETRLEHMIAAQREITRDRLAGLFLYTTGDRLARHGAFGPAWTSAKADGLSLLPSALDPQRS